MPKLPPFFNKAKVNPFWRGHLFLFAKPKPITYTSQQGFKLLLIFVFLELFVRALLLFCSRHLNIVNYNWWSVVNMTILTFLFYFLVKIFARVKTSQLGLYSWGKWSKIEKLYFLQIIPIAIIIFSFFNTASLKVLWSRLNVFEIVLLTLIPQMIWGFYQELLYRGILQTELVRRWGGRKGILVSNLIFTFGPLHAYHFLAAQHNLSHLLIFVAIFCTGLFFSIVFNRSGNLWIIGIMHGLGDLFIEGLAKV